ncbi:MAG: DCC1-like thiol-disulfide oxidoreductase family protein [Gemmatimonadales bacterium]
MNHPEPLLLYDGDCGVCSASVQFILRHDQHARFRFSALDSPIARELLDAYGVSSEMDSVVLLDRGQVLVRSTAIFGVLRRLGGAWHLLRIGRVIPRRWADAGYNWFAHRRGWFSARLGLAACLVPTPEQRARFLT